MLEFSVLHRTLGQALAYHRPDGSKAIANLSAHIAGMLAEHGIEAWEDGAGNLWADTRKDGAVPVLFSAHMDTVARAAGRIEAKVSKKRIVHTNGKSILGADDGAGCAIICALACSGVPGLFLWTQGEETGGHGMRYAIKHNLEQFAGVRCAIAVDRRGQKDICGYQAGDNHASKEFVSALARQLSMGHEWADGVFTDNSMLLGRIPEIVNISAGYEAEHTPNESLDLNYLENLYLAMLKVDFNSLPIVGPTPIERKAWWDRWEGPTYGAWADSDTIGPDQIADTLADRLFIAIGSPEHDEIVSAIWQVYDMGHDDGKHYMEGQW